MSFPLPDWYHDELHFIETEGRRHPLIVDHATGAPLAAIIDGTIVPYADYHADRFPVRTGTPKQPAPIQSGPAGFSFSAVVSDPADPVTGDDES